MKVIFVKNENTRSKVVNLNSFRTMTVLLFAVALFGVGAAWSGYQLAGMGLDRPMLDPLAGSEFEAGLLKEEKDTLDMRIETLQEETAFKLESVAQRLGELKSRLLRMEALGENLIEVAQLDPEEFNFSRPPAMGGPLEVSESKICQKPDYLQELDTLSQQIDDHFAQMELLEMIYAERNTLHQQSLAGTRPVANGWVSSRYGYRSDPIKGRKAWHGGLDFAGKKGTDILSVAAGIVTFSGVKGSYGNVVEIKHPRG
jgi:murein DD-endopeptidase MepM/ murein hydrolase activator NlpD